MPKPNFPILSKLKLLGHLVAILRDTTRTDRVFQFVEGLSHDPVLRAKFPHAPAEQAFLEAPFQMGFPQLDELRAMPEGSLGRALAVHMDALGVDFDEFDRTATPSSDLEWVDRHGYETHDIWHVITGWGTGMANEIGLQGFYAGQLDNIQPTGLILIALIRGLIGGKQDLSAMFEVIVAGWTQGRRSKALFGVDWREHFERPLAAVRRDFEVEPVESEGFVEVADKLAA